MCNDPITQTEVDTSMVSYVDDIHAKHVLKYYNAFSAEPTARLFRANDAMDRIFNDAGYYQNKSKQEIVPVFMGKHSHRVHRCFSVSTRNASQGRALEDARYLGARFSTPSNNAPEIKARLRAITIGWKRLGAFWFTSAPYKMKRLCFISQVQSAAISAGHAFAFSPRECQRLDTQLAKLMRAMMRGKAHSYDPDTMQHNSMSNEQVFRHWLIAPCHLELRIRRLKMMQKHFTEPSKHTQVNACMFGTFVFECSQLGATGIPTSFAHPW